MNFLKLTWARFQGFKTWQKFLIVLLLGSMVAGGFTGSSSTDVSSEKAVQSSPEAGKPETTLDILSKSNVKWENYAPVVKQRISDFIDAGDCQNLQTEFDNADRNNTAQRNRTGESNADLMSLLDGQMKKLACY